MWHRKFTRSSRLTFYSKLSSISTQLRLARSERKLSLEIIEFSSFFKTVLLTCQMELLAKAAACVLAAAFDKQLLDRGSVLFVKQNINQRI